MALSGLAGRYCSGLADSDHMTLERRLTNSRTAAGSKRTYLPSLMWGNRSARGTPRERVCDQAGTVNGLDGRWSRFPSAVGSVVVEAGRVVSAHDVGVGELEGHRVCGWRREAVRADRDRRRCRQEAGSMATPEVISAMNCSRLVHLNASHGPRDSPRGGVLMRGRRVSIRFAAGRSAAEGRHEATIRRSRLNPSDGKQRQSLLQRAGQRVPTGVNGRVQGLLHFRFTPAYDDVVGPPHLPQSGVMEVPCNGETATFRPRRRLRPIRLLT